MKSMKFTSKSLLKGIACTALAFSTAGSLSGQTVGRGSNWDARLAQVELHGVHVQWDPAHSSIVDSWTRISTPFGIRAVLVYYQDQLRSLNEKFEFDKERCTVDELVKAFVATYPGYTSTRDPATGVLWVHPASVAYDKILGAKVKVLRDLVEVPLITGVWQEMVSLGRIRSTTVTLKDSTRNGYDCPVSLPSGAYSIRDMINLCCVSLPDMGIRVVLSPNDGSCAINPIISGVFVPTARVGVQDPTVGALCYWRSTVDPAAEAGLTPDQLIEKLSSADAGVRSAARNYLEMMRFATPDIDNLAQQAAPGEKRLWTAVALVRRFVRMERPDGGFQFIVNPLKEALSSGLLEGKPALKVLAAMELARVRQDTSYLETVARIPLSAADVASVKQDMLRDLHYSKVLRSKMKELNPDWPGFSKEDIAAMEETGDFSLP